jgi:hypothetical protein
MATSPILNYVPGAAYGAAPGPPAPTQPGYLYYWPSIDNLTGGVRETDLDAQDISLLQPDSLIIVTILGRGESQWLRVEDHSGILVTDLNAGIIVPTNYDQFARPYILKRQLGF